MKRPEKLPNSKILYPIRPFHERLQNYIRKRNEIFCVDSLSIDSCRKPKRSSLRLKKYFKQRKESSKFIISSIINSHKDKRYYAKVTFLQFVEYGLLDTGANVTCIGADLATFNFTKFPEFSPTKTKVRTADETLQQTLGVLEVDVCFKGQCNKLRILVVPSLSQRLILGLDFWKSFKLAADVFEDAIVSDSSVSFSSSKNISILSEVSNVIKFSEKPPEQLNTEKHQYPLTQSQKQQLNAINLFPNFEKDGLGRTGLIKHEIDVGGAKPIKQKFYPVSPAVERLMFQEIDRMLSLGVIEESSSPWSSPMRLVLKPSKVRLCLDARKVNMLTRKNAYPLPNIDGIFSRLPRIGSKGCVLANRLSR